MSDPAARVMYAPSAYAASDPASIVAKYPFAHLLTVIQQLLARQDSDSREIARASVFCLENIHLEGRRRDVLLEERDGPVS